MKDDVEIVKARIDKRDYRRVVLRNSLQVLLISDPVTDKVDFLLDLWFRFRFRFGSDFIFSFQFTRSVHDSSVSVLRFCSLQCAASMNVGVGYFSDPADLEGLAHFLGIFSFSSFDSILSRIGFDFCRILVDVLRVWRGFLVWSLMCLNCSL